MSLSKALLTFDPHRRPEQLVYVTSRTTILAEIGGQAWVSIDEDQAARFAEQGILVQLFPEADLLRFPAVVFDPLLAAPQPPGNLAASSAVDSTSSLYYVVQFIAPPQPDWLEAIEEAGGIYVQDNPSQATIFRLTEAQATAAQGMPGVRWVGPYHPAYSLSYELAGREEPFDANSLRDLHLDPAQLATTPVGGLEVSFFDDATTSDMRAQVEALGCQVVADTGYSLILNANETQALALLRLPGVDSLERYFDSEPANQRAGVIVGVNQVRDFGLTGFLTNLDGTGEIVGVIDSGFDGGNGGAVHADLAGRITILNLNGAGTPANSADNFPHGTHVVGTIAGNGANSPAPPNVTNVRGMAPAAQIIIHAAQPAAGGGFNTNNFLNGIENAFTMGARVHNNSWGTGNVVTNNNYVNNISGRIDRLAYLRQELLILFASHNHEIDANANGVFDQNRLTRHAVAKNVLTVGATENVTNLEGFANNWAAFNAGFAAIPGSGVAPVAGALQPISDNNNDMAMFSNRGRVNDPGVPVARRRVKPDIVAPGTNVLSTGPAALLPFPAGSTRRPATAPVASYCILHGTSMATPVVSGAAALTRQYYRQVFGQLRLPTLIEVLSSFINRPTTAAHTDGSVIAWVRPGAGVGQAHIAAARYNRNLDLLGLTLEVRSNVGPSPAPQVARHGDNTLLLYRGADNNVRLSCFDRNLAPVAGFGGAGEVTLAPPSRSEDDRRPAMRVHQDEVAVVWAQNGSTNLLFQRFSALNGAKIDANPLNLGSATSTSSFPYLVHAGGHYAVVWVNHSGGEDQLLFRRVSDAGALPEAQPVVVHHQAAAIKQPHLILNSTGALSALMVVWVDSRTNPDGAIYSHLLELDGSGILIPTEILTVPAGRTMRNPFLQRHPDSGFILLWEEDTQQDPGGAFRFDVYLNYMGSTGLPDGRISGDRLRISDTPNNSAGFTCLADGQAITPVWQSNDEFNSDVLGVFAVNLTKEGVFGVQANPNTPLIQSGRFVNHLLNEHNDTGLTGQSIAWAGGDYYLLRARPDGPGASLQLVHTNADGLPDVAFGAQGARDIQFDFGYDRVHLHWTVNGLAAAHLTSLGLTLFRFDNTGAAINAFGGAGQQTINEISTDAVSPGLGHRGAGASFRLLAAWAQRGAPQHTLRYAVLDGSGNNVVAPRNLGLAAGIRADGTARRGWFHFVESESPDRSIAAWHRTDPASGTLGVFINRFNLDGTRQHSTDTTLTAMAGDSLNAVIAPRPVVFEPALPGGGAVAQAAALNASRRRQYGVAWQFRPNAAAPWEIRYSGLDRQGRLLAATATAPNDVQVVAGAFDATHPQLVWHTNGYGLAWLQQTPAGGAPGATERQLFFTVIDPDGNRPNLALPGAAALPAAMLQVSASGADVQDFHLIWNGRSFRLSWTEAAAGKLRHMQTALMVSRQQGQNNTYRQPTSHPSSALIRATLINGATNMQNTNLPNVGNNPNDGYGWGRLNLRQSLTPLPPVTMHVRDDGAVAAGRSVRYHFTLPRNTRLLRITLAYTDPPQPNNPGLVNNLNLMLRTPDGRVFVGNNWGAIGTAAAPFSNPQPDPPPAAAFESVHNTEQIVVAGAPNLTPGDYIVDVIGQTFANSPFQLHPGQPYALVFVGSGVEAIIAPPGAGGAIPVY